MTGAAGRAPQPGESHRSDDSGQFPTPTAEGSADPISRIGSWRWQRISSFREANNLSHEQAGTLIDLVQSERIALRVLAKESKGQDSQQIEQKARMLKRVTDAKVAAQLGDETGAKWRTFRESSWGKRR